MCQGFLCVIHLSCPLQKNWCSVCASCIIIPRSRIFLLLKGQNQISLSRKSFSIAAITAKHSGAFSFSKAIVKSYSFRRGKYLFQRAFKDISESYGALTVKAARNYGAVAKDPHLVSEPVAKAIFVFIDHFLSLGIGLTGVLSSFGKFS